MHQHAVEVSFKGEANGALADEFDCLAVIVGRGVTHLHVAADDSAVHGILAQIDALGLELLAVRELADGPPIARPTHQEEPQ